jgi:hypothetical protein
MHPLGYVFQQLLDGDEENRTHLRRQARRLASRSRTVRPTVRRRVRF